MPSVEPRLTQVLSSQLWVKQSAVLSRSSVCLPPRVPCVSRHIKPDHARATITPSVCTRGLAPKVNVLPRQSSPSTRARRRLGLRVGIRPFARRQQGAARRCALQPLPCAASRSSTQLVRTCCRARIACASRFATRQPIPTVARASAGRCLGAVRRTYPPDMYDPGARSTHRPQAVVIPRLRHLGWPRMRGVASHGVQPLRTNCRGAGRPRRPNRPPRPRVAVQAMADGSPGGGRARLVGTLQVGSDICTSKFIYKGLLCLTRGGWAAASARAAGCFEVPNIDSSTVLFRVVPSALRS